MISPENEKIAVILFNLGGPLQEKDIQPFLFNFFMDKNILSVPPPVRYILARWISWRRARGAAKKAYGALGGKSPLLENTRAQAQALETALMDAGRTARVFVSMRYWKPLAEDVIQNVSAYKPDRMVLLPLYPQYSTATTLSSLQDWKKLAGTAIPAADICCYPQNAGFIAASAELIKEALVHAPKRTRILFSAHGLPEKTIRSGDPYQNHCEQTADAIVKKLNIPLLDWQLCYQSRIGPLRWIGPSVEQALEKAADDKVGVVIYPLAFVSEHVETLVEIDKEYRHRAESMGIRPFIKVPTVGTHPLFIQGLRDLVLDRLDGAECRKGCVSNFSKCFRRIE